MPPGKLLQQLSLIVEAIPHTAVPAEAVSWDAPLPSNSSGWKFYKDPDHWEEHPNAYLIEGSQNYVLLHICIQVMHPGHATYIRICMYVCMYAYQ